MLGSTNAKISTNNPSGSGTTLNGQYRVLVIDYDGSIIDEKYLNQADEYTLPQTPNHTGLVFQGWSSTETINNNKIIVTDNNIMVGPIYTTESGQNEFDIELTTSTGLSVTLKMNGDKDWGDGTTNTDTTHTYTDYGNYTIKCNGTTITASSSSGLFGQQSSTNNYNYYVKNARLATVTNIPSYTFSYCCSLNSIILSNTISNISNSNCFNYCYSLSAMIFPTSITSIGASQFSYCASLKSIVIPNTITTLGSGVFSSCRQLENVVLPNSISSLSNSTFSSCYNLKFMIIPNGITTIRGSAFYECYSLNTIIMADSVVAMEGSVFTNCRALKNIKFSNNLSSIGNQAFYQCYSLESITLPDSLININGSDIFRYCHSLSNFKMSDNVTFIASSITLECPIKSVKFSRNLAQLNTFGCNYCTTEYDFSNCLQIPILNSSFSLVNKTLKIKVPASLYDEWIEATNWVAYADYIVAV